MKLTPCTKEEHDAFVTDYPRPLVRDVLRISTPDQLQHNDFSLGNWPESVVAAYDLWGHTPGDIWGKDPGDYAIYIETPGLKG